jgi:hypothetical protein
MKLLIRLLVFYLFLITSASKVFSQSYTKCRYTSFGASIKTAYFMGDVATAPELLRPGFGFHINRQITPHSHIMIETSWLRLIGDDYTASFRAKERNEFYYLRNLHFVNDIKELAITAKYDLIPNYDSSIKRPIYNFYLTYGLMGFHHKPRAKHEDGYWMQLRTLKTENQAYSSFGFGIPIGAGFRYKINMQWDVEAEITYRITFTDYLDDVSKRYEAPENLSEEAIDFTYRSLDEIAAYSGQERDFNFIQSTPYTTIQNNNARYLSGFGPGNNRGSFFGWDNYLAFTLRFSYNSPSKINCPKFREN